MAITKILELTFSWDCSFKIWKLNDNNDLNKNEKIKTLNDLNLSIDISGEKTIKLNDDEIVVAGNKKAYLIDINNYEILHEINTNFYNCSILKLSNNLFLVGDENGNITQYKIENKKNN